MNLLIFWIISAIAVFVSAYILPGVQVDNFWTALVVAVVLGIVNVVLKPILLVLTLPVTILTFGLFAIVINAFLILLVARLVNGFTVDGFGWALLYSLVLSAVSMMLYSVQQS